MKICFLNESLSEGGIGRVVSIIMRELAKIHSITVCCLLFAKNTKKEIYTVNNDILIDYLLDMHVSMKRAIFREKIIKKVRDYLKRERIDVLIACGDLFFPVAIMSAIGLATKVLCWDHTAPNVNTDQSFQYISRIFGTKYSDYNLVLTKYALKQYNKRLNKNKNFQIYNPVDPEACIGYPEYNHNSKRIISVGRLCYQKNFFRLLDIAKIIIVNNPEWNWDIYGDGSEKDELMKKCKELKLDNNVHFLGQVGNLYNVYSKYAFLVMTSRYEGFPMTLLEGSAKALPLVAFDVKTGPNEIIIDGYNGFLCEENNDIQMINHIQELINSKDLRLEMSKNSINRSKEFNISNIIQKWNRMLYTIIGE